VFLAQYQKGLAQQKPYAFYRI